MGKVAVVTGSNKNIGYFIAKGLCKKLPTDSTVIITSRDLEAGKAAVARLKEEKLTTGTAMQLDITNRDSIDKFVSEVKTLYGGVDILVNNAGFAYKQAATEPFGQQAEVTVNVNYFGTLNFSNAMFPLLRPDARVVNMASMAGGMSFHKCSPEVQKQFAADSLTEKELTALMNSFIQDAKTGDKAMEKWAPSAYGMSKLGVLALNNIQARGAAPGILVNAACPGWCKSDMAGWEKPPKTAEEGAETPIFLATLPHESKISGKFYSELAERQW